MQYLDAVNTVLRSLGENPVAALDVRYPTMNLVLPALDTARIELLTEGWWFNTRYNISLEPDTLGVVTVPADTLSFCPDDSSITFEGSRFVNKDTGAPVVSQSVAGVLVSDLTFEACPSSAQYAIAHSAAYSVYVADNGIDNTAQDIQRKIAGFYRTLSADHVRAQKVSSYQRPNVRRWLRNLRSC